MTTKTESVTSGWLVADADLHPEPGDIVRQRDGSVMSLLRVVGYDDGRVEVTVDLDGEGNILRLPVEHFALFVAKEVRLWHLRY